MHQQLWEEHSWRAIAAKQPDYQKWEYGNSSGEGGESPAPGPVFKEVAASLDKQVQYGASSMASESGALFFLVPVAQPWWKRTRRYAEETCGFNKKRSANDRWENQDKGRFEIAIYKIGRMNLYKIHFEKLPRSTTLPETDLGGQSQRTRRQDQAFVKNSYK